MYRELLVPTDGGQGMSRVIDEAIELAPLCDARVHALHAIDETT